MKPLHILLAATGALVAYKFYWANRVKRANTVVNLGNPINGISEIFTGAKKGQEAFGWRYFTDGSAISPNGTYYLNGQPVWSPAG